MAPSPWTWPAAWVELTAAVVLTAAYALAARRHPPARRRHLCFAAAIVILLAVSVTPLSTLALHYVLWAHLVQNVALAEWIPLLLVASVPPELAGRAARVRVVRELTRPLVALPLWLGAYLAWHVPVAYDSALERPALLALEHLTYLVAGLLLWWPVLHSEPWRLSSGAKAAYLFAAFVFASPLGLLMALLPTPLYDFYVEAPRLRGLSPLADQQVAGIVMAVSESVVFFTMFTIYFVRFMAEEAERRRGSPGRRLAAMAAAFSARGLAKRYGPVTALDGVSLDVGEGELVGLLGPNGAGKSTLVKIGCGLVRASAGEAHVCGARAGSLEARRSLGYLAELFRFPGWASADELLALHQRLAGSRGGAAERMELLELVGLAEARSRRVETMSKGMQQRLGIAQALVGDPRFLFLDEPTSALDPAGGARCAGCSRSCGAAGSPSSSTRTC